MELDDCLKYESWLGELWVVYTDNRRASNRWRPQIYGLTKRTMVCIHEQSLQTRELTRRTLVFRQGQSPKIWDLTKRINMFIHGQSSKILELTRRILGVYTRKIATNTRVEQATYGVCVHGNRLKYESWLGELWYVYMDNRLEYESWLSELWTVYTDNRLKYESWIGELWSVYIYNRHS